MKNIFLVLFLFVASTLGGCGGGGGGGGGSGSGGTPGGGGLTVSVFSAGDRLNGPRHMVFYGGNLYVANQGGNNVLKIDSLGVQSQRLTGITNPIGLTTDGSDFFVSGTVAGTGQGIFPFAVTDASVLRARFAACNCYGLVATPTTSVISSTGRLYAAEQTNNEVNVYRSGSVLLAHPSVADKPTGLGIFGTSVYVTRFDVTTMSVIDAAYSPSTFVGPNALLNQPNGIAVNQTNGDMYVVNEGTPGAGKGTAGASTVLKITSAGVVSEFLSTSDGLCSATGVAISGNALYVSNGDCTAGATAAEKNYILKVSPI